MTMPKSSKVPDMRVKTLLNKLEKYNQSSPVRQYKVGHTITLYSDGSGYVAYIGKDDEDVQFVFNSIEELKQKLDDKIYDESDNSDLTISPNLTIE